MSQINLLIFCMFFCPSLIFSGEPSITGKQKLNVADFKYTFEQVLLPQFNKAAWDLLKQRYDRKRAIWKKLNAESDEYHPITKVEEEYKDQFKFLFKEKYNIVFGNQSVPHNFNNLEELAKIHGYGFYNKKNNSWWAWLFFPNVDCSRDRNQANN